MKPADAIGGPCARQANGIASLVQDLLAPHTSSPLVPDRDPKLHCIRVDSILQRQAWATVWHAFDEGPCGSQVFRPPSRKKPILRGLQSRCPDPLELSSKPASSIPLADGRTAQLSLAGVFALHTISLSRSQRRSFIRLLAPAYEVCRPSRQCQSLPS